MLENNKGKGCICNVDQLMYVLKSKLYLQGGVQTHGPQDQEEQTLWMEPEAMFVNTGLKSLK